MSSDAQLARTENAGTGLSRPAAPPAPASTAAGDAEAPAGAPAEQAVASPVDAPPSVRWAGEPTLESEGRRFYAAFDSGSQRYSLGDAVYLCPADPGAPPFVAHLESLHEQLPGGAGGGSPCKATAAQGSMWAGVRWFYRPSELDVEGPFRAEDSELFWADEYAVHPLEAVCGKCTVLTPAQADRRPHSSAAHPGGSDVYVCSRKYLPDERRIAPLDDGVEGVTLASALQQKPFEAAGDRAVQRPPTAADRAAARPRPKRVRGGSTHAGRATVGETLGSLAAAQTGHAAEPAGEELPPTDLAEPSTIDPLQPLAKKRRHEQAHGKGHSEGPAHPGMPAAAGAAAGSGRVPGEATAQPSARGAVGQGSPVSGGDTKHSG